MSRLVKVVCLVAAPVLIALAHLSPPTPLTPALQPVCTIEYHNGLQIKLYESLTCLDRLTIEPHKPGYPGIAARDIGIGLGFVVIHDKQTNAELRARRFQLDKHADDVHKKCLKRPRNEYLKCVGLG